VSMSLYPVKLGDRRRIASGWLVLSEGAVRGILSASADGEVLFGFACDRRIEPEGGMMQFRDLPEAHAWLERRLRSRARPGNRPEWHDDRG
jgi:hypothetical protein